MGQSPLTKQQGRQVAGENAAAANNGSGSSGSSSHDDDDESFVDVADRTVRAADAAENNSTKRGGGKPPQQRVAVIGGGVSGLAAAWHLQTNTDDDVTVDIFEREPQLGGHACTVDVPTDYTASSNIPVDIGFMVFNDANYPNMVEWFRALDGVETEQSDMSLSVSLDRGATIEWSSDGVLGGGSWWQHLQNLPSLCSLARDVWRFHREAAEILLLHDGDPRKHVSTRDYLRQHRYSDSFAAGYLLPMMAALWSASLDDVRQFPAAELVGFLCHHQMLQLFRRPVWKTVSGRSRRYVASVEQAMGGEERVHCDTAIAQVERVSVNNDDSNNDSCTKYRLTTADGTVRPELYDHVVFACHPPAAAAMLLRHDKSGTVDDGGGDDRQRQLLDLLNRIEYADNVVYVHSDPSLMPASPSCWASWNCLGKSAELLRSSTGNSTSATASGSSNKRGEAFEGAESGFGNKWVDKKRRGKKDRHQQQQHSEKEEEGLEGEEGRFKAVYVT